jgi:hypothetical protein
MKPSVLRSASLFLCSVVLALPLFATGTVYLVLGSDTAIWDGMDVSRYRPHYDLSLYIDPAQNAYKVMDPAWRARYVDSYGVPIKFTWWMMAGDIYRYADNTNVPVPNIMTLYLMKKYHGDRVKQFGDELSMHYHTFAWTDYDGDGKYYWNQAHGFDECREDFDVTMAQFLLEENTYPVSFRSGWHYMDNTWQHYLNELLPYSMHDDYPAKRYVTNEPIDNNYDWSLSSSLWGPFRPSDANYQLGGGTKGWNLRSKHIGSVTQSIMNGMFLNASKGLNQMACFWGHLPETDFLDNMAKVDTLAHKAAAAYPGVKFRYCTAVEAMQRWRHSVDSTAPVLTFTSQRSGETLTFTIQSNEPIFQAQPFVAMKDLYERASVLACTKTGEGTWTAVSPMPASAVAKAAVAVTDTMGNLATAHLNFLPDDIYIDNLDSGYAETRGAWTSTTNTSWGADARQAVLVQNDSVASTWSATIPQTTNYNVFIQIPAIANAAVNSIFRIKADGAVLAEKRFTQAVQSKAWIHIGTVMLASGARVTVEQVENGAGQAGKIASADVVKISALVRQHAISTSQSLVDCGAVSEADTGRVNFSITNGGIAPLTIQSIGASSPAVSFGIAAVPFEIPPMTTVVIPVRVYSLAKGLIADTITIKSNDELTPELKIPLTAAILNYFTVADNDDPLSYTETGAWSNSVASDCYGATSRFAAFGSNSRAVFKRTPLKTGIYDLQEIMPKTVNASKHARYRLRVNGAAADSAIIDQNAGSGAWVTVFTRQLSAAVPVEIEVTDASTDNADNHVLRADAVRYQLTIETTVKHPEAAGSIPADYELAQNYPNPFNPSTTIRFGLPVRSHVRLEVFNTLGQSVAVLEDGAAEAGTYQTEWHAAVPSGLYFLRMHAQSMEGRSGAGGEFTQIRKMLLLR